MNYIDLIIFILLIISFIFGLSKGIFSGAISIISFILAWRYRSFVYPFYSDLFAKYFQLNEYDKYLVPIVSFVSIIILSIILLKIIFYFVKKVLVGISIINHILGGLVAFIISFVAIGIISKGIDKISPICKADDPRLTSKYYYLIQDKVYTNQCYLMYIHNKNKDESH